MKKASNLLVANKTAKRHATPANATTHQTASKRLPAISVDAVAILVVDRDRLGAGAHKRVLPAVAHGSVKATCVHGGDVAVGAVSSGDVEIGGGQIVLKEAQGGYLVARGGIDEERLREIGG